ncbi:hypothetical protein CULT_130013 [[Clostridium] ultunense Esp]|nr:hypothetical protein CULT_130013 [[Clostridium] ultunense Esp]
MGHLQRPIGGARRPHRPGIGAGGGFAERSPPVAAAGKKGERRFVIHRDFLKN